MERTLETLQEYLETDIKINKDWLSNSDFMADVISKYMTGTDLTFGQKQGLLNSITAQSKLASRIPYDENAEPIGNWVGKEKKRYDFVLKYIKGNQTSRGFSVHKFKDRHSNAFTIFSDHEKIPVILDPKGDAYLKRGDIVKVKATVNRHSMNTHKFNSEGAPIKETVLNRPKFNEIIGNTNELHADSKEEN